MGGALQDHKLIVRFTILFLASRIKKTSIAHPFGQVP